jgi:hypothetical protein
LAFGECKESRRFQVPSVKVKRVKGGLGGRGGGGEKVKRGKVEKEKEVG